MNIKLEAYLAQTGKTYKEFGLIVKAYRQKYEHWEKHGTPIIVEVDPITWEIIEARIEDIKVIYTTKEK